MIRYCALLALALLLHASALAQHTSRPQSDRTSTRQQTIQEMVSQVSRDSAVALIRALGDFQTRYEYTLGQDSAASWLARTMDRWGTVTSDWYSFGEVTFSDLDFVTEDVAWCVPNAARLLRTTNGGATWSEGASGLSKRVNSVDFVDANHGWIAGLSGFVASTRNGAEPLPTWNTLHAGISATLCAVRFLDTTFGIVAGISHIVRRTTDGGATWLPASLPSPARDLYDIAIVDTAHLWMVGNAGEILFSSNAGSTWQKQTSGSTFDLASVKFLSVNDGWCIGAGTTALHTTNGGQLWQTVTLPRSEGEILKGVDFADSLHGWIVSYGGWIFRTTDGGSSWQKSRLALRVATWGPEVMCVSARNSTELYVGGSRGILRKSTDGGNTWLDQTPNLPANYVHVSRNIVLTIPGATSPQQECVMVAHYDSYSGNPMVLAPGADDNGSGSSAVLEAARIMPAYAFQKTVKLVLVSGEELGMYGSTAFVEHALAEGRDIVGAVNGDMIGYPSAADTARLVALSYLTRNQLLDSLVVYNLRYNIGLTLVTGADSTCASDYGPFAIAGLDAVDLAEATANDVWGGSNPYYHKTTDTWEKVHPGLIARGAQLMLSTIAELAVPVGKATSIQPEPEIPTEIALMQNYPNPFNPKTRIRYQVSGVSDVKLAVYDILGREVAVLVDEKKTSGNYQVEFDGTKLSSGVYFYRLTAGDYVETQRMMLVR
jgi:photosystem II stability/assembly factor-like uncharacterized protein